MNHNNKNNLHIVIVGYRGRMADIVTILILVPVQHYYTLIRIVQSTDQIKTENRVKIQSLIA